MRAKHYSNAIFIALIAASTLLIFFFFVDLVSPALASVAEMYYSMGQQYMEQGKYEMAALAFEKVVGLVPDWPEAHNALGLAYAQLFRFEDALSELSRAVTLKPDYSEAKTNYRRTMMSAERYKPVQGPRLSRGQRFAILGGILAAITLISALVIIYSSD